MASAVQDPNMAERIDAATAALTDLLAGGVAPLSARDAITCITEIERLRRLVDVAGVELHLAIEAANMHRPDGHASAKVMVRHHAKLSGAEALGRQQVGRMLATCPEIAAAYRAGELGVDQVRTLARTHANPRVKEKMERRQDWFLGKARLSHDEFVQHVENWRRLADEDGPTPPGERAHENRNARLDQDFDTTWSLIGSFSSTMGLQMHEILDKYVQAETLADWEKARAEHGDQATADHLPRTIRQRRADALWQIFIDAADNPNSAVPADFVHNIVWDAATFEAMADRFFCDDDVASEPDVEAAEPADESQVECGCEECDATASDPADDLADTGGLDPDTMMCRSIDGIRLDPTDAFSTAIVAGIRRVLVDAKSTVIDLGVARFFTGNARHAVKLTSTCCVWPGCQVPTSVCEIDHMREHGGGGRTNPGNGAPLCGKHNRWKQKGFTLWRDPMGHWHVYRPDGTEIPN